LIKAVESGDCSTLIDSKFLVNVGRMDHASDFPLLLAAGVGALEMIICLLDLGADMYATNDHGHSAIHASSLFGRPNTLAFLIDYGFSVDLRNRKGELLLEEVLEDIGYSKDIDTYRQLDLNALQYCRCSLGQHLRRNVISS
jgi:ankyrin repeat protein